MTKKLAYRLKLALEEVSPFIQQITSVVCPVCEKVCCIDRHGHYNDGDLIYVRALGLERPAYREGVLDTDPCQFLAKSGCALERSVRPFRCNWYFCNALLDYMEQIPPKPYREFIGRFHEIIELRTMMLDEHSKLSCLYIQTL